MKFLTIYNLISSFKKAKNLNSFNILTNLKYGRFNQRNLDSNQKIMRDK